MTQHRLRAVDGELYLIPALFVMNQYSLHTMPQIATSLPLLTMTHEVHDYSIGLIASGILLKSSVSGGIIAGCLLVESTNCPWVPVTNLMN